VDQGSGLQRVALPLSSHISGGLPVQFVIDKREQVIPRGRLSFAAFVQHLCDVCCF
jgi:hypothetical protein